MLQIHALSYRYPGARDAQLEVRDFSLESGRHAVLLGPSGSGKSTLLHLIAAILKPQQGRLIAAGTDLAALGPREADAWRGANVGFLPQKMALVPSLSARENILLAAYAPGKSQDRARADALLDALGIGDKASARPQQLSQGQQQRVALARALYHRPGLLLADEPTANLDDRACALAIELLVTQAAQAGASLVIATHDARVLAALPEAQVLRLSVPEASA
ncbi:MAG TPA: ATP-binding cassette domain-containing protein [Noviherbaspirillum sp.]|nr:ATP-binding cassette domain-containing protein [Noviherbaspirillum sp.]